MTKSLTPEQEKAYVNLNIRKEDRVILSLDGGGVRGILTIQLLKKIEEIAGMPCHQFCDFVAGTSTGAIIGGMIANGKTAVEIEALYIKFITKVFMKRALFANRFVNPPAYDKINYRRALQDELGNITLKDACIKSGLDILITAKNATDNEEDFFTCFNNNGFQGTYQDALLRAVLEATMSAPTYFSPLERFLDGGTTTYNNPATAAIMEALEYGGKGKYDAAHITVFSLATGKTVKSISPEDLESPKGFDTLFWLNYVMDTASQDASAMQSDLFRSKILDGVDFRRFQISLDSDSLRKLPDRSIAHIHESNADKLSEVPEAELINMQMDDVSKFGLLREIGQAMADYIMTVQCPDGKPIGPNKFQRDLNNTPTGRDELVRAFFRVPEILKNITRPEWIDSRPSK